MSLDSSRLFQFAHFKFSNLKTVKSFVWTSSKFYKTWKMVFPVVPVVTELLRNDERLLFYSASKLQKCWEGGQSLTGTPRTFFGPPFSCELFSRFSWTRSLCFHLQAERRNLNVSVDVETIVLACQHHTPVVHQSHIKALGVFHLEK